MQSKWCERIKPKGSQCDNFSLQHDWLRSSQFHGQLTQVTFALIPTNVIQGLNLKMGHINVTMVTLDNMILKYLYANRNEKQG